MKIKLPHLFELLKKAYIDARYKMDEYEVTQSELEKLSSYVTELKNKTEEICKEKIRQIGGKTHYNTK